MNEYCLTLTLPTHTFAHACTGACLRVILGSLSPSPILRSSLSWRLLHPLCQLGKCSS